MLFALEYDDIYNVNEKNVFITCSEYTLDVTYLGANKIQRDESLKYPIDISENLARKIYILWCQQFHLQQNAVRCIMTWTSVYQWYVVNITEKSYELYM